MTLFPVQRWPYLNSKSLGACIVLLIIAIIRGRTIRDTKLKAQRLVLACAYFDEDGRLMVTQEGALPSEKITNRYVDQVSEFARPW